MKTTSLFAISAAALLALASAQAQTKDYTGTNNQPWATGTNWNPGGAPTGSDSVTVANGNTVRIQSTTAAVASSLTIGGASTGAVAMIDTTTNSLTVGGNITLASGAGNGILFLRKANNTLTLNGGAGSILNGGGAGTASLNLDDGFAGSLGLLNANVDDIVMGQQPGTVTLNITSGQTYNVARLLYLNHASAAASAATININGGTLHVGGSELRMNSGTHAGNTAYLNINSGGRLTAVSIRRSNAGTDAAIIWNDGTIANYAGGNLTLQATTGAGSLNILLAGTGTHTFEAESGRTITVASTAVLADKSGENGTLRKTGAGSLVFQGTNTYTGLTTVENGTLVVTNAVSSATISSNSVAVQFASVPALGTYPILAGPVAAGSLAIPSVTVAGSGALGNAVITNSPNLAVVVGTAPVITSATNASGVVGQPFSYQISASNNPASYSATGLPDELGVNTQTGLISGTPTVATFAGTFTVTASNAFGAASQSVAIQLAHASEPGQGDFSNAPEAPTALGTISTGQTVLGSVGGSDTDDYLTFSVPAGYRLQSVRLRLYSTTDTTGTIAIDEGATWTAGDNAAAMLGSAPFWAGDVGADLLTTMNVAGSSLNAGAYTLRVRCTGAAATYGFDFKLVAVGAPSGEITATPSTVYLVPGQLGATTISWATVGCAAAQVTVLSAGGSEQLLGDATSHPGVSAPWISEGRVSFRLYGDRSRTLLLDEVVVTGAPTPLRVAGVFGNDMVLQRNAEVPVWGWADPGQTVQVTFAGQAKTSVAGSDGQWTVNLDPMPASETGRTMTISNGATSRSFTGILVGEVWVLSGQSNMAMTIADCGDTAAAARANYPWLRTFRSGWPFGTEQQPDLAPYRTEPAADVPSGSVWSDTSPANAGNCYAVGFYFAESLRQSVGPGVPIGLLQVAVGSTWGECWVSKTMRDADPALGYIGTTFWPTPPGSPWFVDKYVMYHALIAPLQPYGIRGVLWYQGEGNTDPTVGHYRDLLTTLIQGWRGDWGQGNFPFLIVQLPAYGGTKDPWHSYELLREAQLQVSQETANTGLAITIDTGGTADPHPVDKQPIGERLARLARAQVYGQAITPTGPIYTGGTADAGGVNLRFDHAGSGLQAVGGALRTFEVAGADGVFQPAIATITAADTVRVTCTAVPAIVEVRYGWDWNPDCNLFNSEMLPASPFRAAMEGSIAAGPSKITIFPGTTGSSTITWETNLSPGAHVTRSSGGGAEEQIGAASAGGVTVSGLGAGKTIFRLYGDQGRSRLLDEIEVIGTVSPLTVQSDGSVRLDNRPYQGLGVNYFDAFDRVLWNAADTSYEAGFQALGQWGVPFVRLDVSGYQPIYQNLFFTNRAEYFRRLDAVVASAERHGVGLIPSLFWTTFTFADLAGEHLDQLAITNSVTRQKMREFATEIINRYKGSRAIWAWEFGNEWNLAVDLPNASLFLPPTWTDLGNPATRDPVRDVLTTDIILPAMQEFAQLANTLDPGRPVSTGHAIPRTAAWHMDQWQRGLLPIDQVWTTDSPAQAGEIALRQCPAPFDLLSIHAYEIIADIPRVATYAQIAAESGIALFVGEFGANTAADYNQFLAASRAAPLAAMWSYDRVGDAANDGMNATTTNSRSWMLQALQPSTFSSWSRGWSRGDLTGPGGETAFHEYAFGAPSPGAGSVRAAGGLSSGWLSLEAVVRTNDASVTILGERSFTLVPESWTGEGVSSVPSADQSGVLPGCQRRIYSVPQGSADKQFLRVRARTP